MDARDRVLDAALDLHEAVAFVRRQTADFRSAPACSRPVPYGSLSGPRPCFEEDEAWRRGESIDHYCPGCQVAAAAARWRYRGRRRVAQVRARLVRAALSRTIWATRRDS